MKSNLPPLRILHVAYLVNRNDFIDVIVRGGDRTKFDISVCTFVREGNIESPEYERDGISHSVLSTGLNKKSFLKSIFRLAKIIRRKKIDLVHSHHYYESLIAAAAAVLSGRTKLIVSRHYHDELYITTAGLKLKMYLLLEHWVNRYATCIISPSDAISDLLRKQNVPESKIVRITYGFNFAAVKYQPLSKTEAADVRKNLGVATDTFLIGNFARHHLIKGQDFLLDAFALFHHKRPASKLLMVGDGPYHQELLARTKELKLEEAVIFTGWQRELRPFISSVDLVLHPTHQEAFPQIMIEAMALGKALIITPVSGAGDIIQNNINGFLIPFRDPSSWADTLDIVCLDRRELDRIGQCAADFVRSNFSIDKIIPTIESVYTKVTHRI